MRTYSPGAIVCVDNLPYSSWRKRTGVVVSVLQRETRDSGTVQECEVSFGEERRWFLSRHLRVFIPPKSLRFFRNEVAERWKEITFENLETLDADRDQLLRLLQDQYGFARKRAERETDTFISEFVQRVRRSEDPSIAGCFEDMLVFSRGNAA